MVNAVTALKWNASNINDMVITFYAIWEPKEIIYSIRLALIF